MIPGQKDLIMNDKNTYLIQLRGQLDVTDLNAASPLVMRVVTVDITTTSFTVSTDQSGLIGLLRHLHARGMVILSVSCKPQTYLPGEENVN